MGSRSTVRDLARSMAWPLLLLSLLLVLPTPAPAADPPEIHNGAAPAHGTRTLHLKEMWRAGGEEDATNFFGLVNQVASDEQGRLYLLDPQLVQVHVYDAQGGFVGTLGRQGEGPGEVQRPTDLVVLPTGQVGMLDAIGTKLVLLEPDGAPAGSVTFGAGQGAFVQAGEVACHDGHYVVMGGEGRRDDEGMQMTNYLSICGADGQEQKRVLEHKGPRMGMGPPRFVESEQDFVGRGRWTLGPDGRIYAAPERDRYAVHVYDPQGNPERVISRDYTPRKRTEEDLEQLKNQVVAIVNGQRLQIEHELEETDPCIARLSVADNGELWVIHAWSLYDQPEGIFTTYDVFDRDGHYQEKVQIAVDGDNQRDRLFRLDDDRYVLVRRYLDARRAQFSTGDDADEEAEAEPLEVVYYRVSD